MQPCRVLHNTRAFAVVILEDVMLTIYTPFDRCLLRLYQKGTRLRKQQQMTNSRATQEIVGRICESCGQPPLQCSLIHGCAVRQGDRFIGEVAREGGIQSCRGMPTPTIPKGIAATFVARVAVVVVILILLFLLFSCFDFWVVGIWVSVANLLCFKKASNPYVCWIRCWLHLFCCEVGGLLEQVIMTPGSQERGRGDPPQRAQKNIQ